MKNKSKGPLVVIDPRLTTHHPCVIQLGYVWTVQLLIHVTA